MILERFEPKKSTKVALWAPGRPIKVAPGAFPAGGRGVFTLPLKWHTVSSVTLAKGTLSLVSVAKEPKNAPGATLNGRPGAHNATLVDFLGSNRSRIIQFERIASD